MDRRGKANRKGAPGYCCAGPPSCHGSVIMGYLLRMSQEIREWIIGLREADPPAALALGHALAAVLREGSSVGQPLVVPLARAPVGDLREAPDDAYQDRLERMRSVRRLVAGSASLVAD